MRRVGDEGRLQQSVDVQALAVGSEENIDEIRFENDMIKFIFFCLECKIIIIILRPDSIFPDFFFFFQN